MRSHSPCIKSIVFVSRFISLATFNASSLSSFILSQGIISPREFSGKILFEIAAITAESIPPESPKINPFAPIFFA